MLTIEKVDLILLDVTMLRMDGFQFLAARETHPELEEVPVIRLLNCRADYDIMYGIE